jgi:hypothetical protein
MKPKQLSLTDEKCKHQKNTLQVITEAMRLFYDKGRGRKISVDVEATPKCPNELDLLGFSKLDCDAAMQRCDFECDRASAYLFGRFRLNEAMAQAFQAFQFASFFIWEEKWADKACANVAENVDAMCMEEMEGFESQDSTSIGERNSDEFEPRQAVCLVCSYEEFVQRTPHVLAAEAQGIPIVSEYFVWDSEYFPAACLPSPSDYPVVQMKRLFETSTERLPFHWPDENVVLERLRECLLDSRTNNNNNNNNDNSHNLSNSGRSRRKSPGSSSLSSSLGLSTKSSSPLPTTTTSYALSCSPPAKLSSYSPEFHPQLSSSPPLNPKYFISSPPLLANSAFRCTDPNLALCNSNTLCLSLIQEEEDKKKEEHNLKSYDIHSFVCLGLFEIHFI